MTICNTNQTTLQDYSHTQIPGKFKYQEVISQQIYPTFFPTKIQDQNLDQ